MKSLRPVVVRPLVRLIALGVFCAATILAARASGQEWSAQQKEVWKNVETYWALDAAGDTQGFLAYFHADYQGWSYNDALPGSKERAAKFITHGHKTSKTLVYDLQPVAVRVHGNIAYVHYLWTRLIKDAEGKEKRQAGRWTDILTKDGGKWVMIGDHGGEIAPKT